jgi:hypothetical protein
VRLIIVEGTPEEILKVAHLFRGEPVSAAAPPEPNTDATASAEPESVGPPPTPAQAIQAMLTRLPIPDSQRDVYRALAGGKVEYGTYLERLGRTKEQLRGVHGALGNRINNTPEIHQAGLPGNTDAVLVSHLERGKRFFSLTPHAREALRAEGIIE